MNNVSANKKPACVLVMGGPASGKGTHCKKLSKIFGFIHLSIGDILREQRIKDNEQGKFLDFHMREFENSGILMPSTIVAQYLFFALNQNGWDKNVFLIDGFIKAKGGYDCWQKMFSKLLDLKFVLYLECSESTMLARMLERSNTGDRLDDNENIYITRIRTFYDRTYPCIELFAAENFVRKVNTENSIKMVNENVIKTFQEFF